VDVSGPDGDPRIVLLKPYIQRMGSLMLWLRFEEIAVDRLIRNNIVQERQR
jgi:hypothetical protein